MSEYKAQNNIELSQEKIRRHFSNKYKDTRLFVYDVTDSTNKQAKLYATENSPRGENTINVFIADRQTEGRGRLGKKFYSPGNCGLYLSILLDIGKSITSVDMVTIAAAVGVCDAIKELYDITPDIKWVNDIYLNGKKLCGILAEAVNNPETGTIESIVIGIGVNCTTESFPEDISKTATSLAENSHIKSSGAVIDRNNLAAKIIENVVDLLEKNDKKQVMNQYRAYSFVCGKEVTYILKDLNCKGIVKEINDNGNLIVERDNGTIDVLYSGEVSIKGDWKTK